MAIQLLRPEWSAKIFGAILIAIVLQQTVEGLPSRSKRSLSALARTSQLPHSSAPGDQNSHDRDNNGHGSQHEKRSVAALARAGELPRISMEQNKRYVGALARTGELPFVREQNKRDTLRDLLREEILREELDEGRTENKRSLSSLARAGELPYVVREQEKRDQIGDILREELMQSGDDLIDDKRSVSSLVRAGNLPINSDKRSVESLARHGLLSKNTREDKRGISSLAKAGELPGKRRYNEAQEQEDLEAMLEELFAAENSKRSVSSLARTQSFPEPVKRHLGSLLNGKRSVAVLASHSNFPVSEQQGKRMQPFDWEDDDLTWGKRNVAALLRQTKFSSGDTHSNMDEGDHGDESESEIAGQEQKRYLGSVRGSQGRAKRSAWAEDDVDDEEDLSGEIASPYVQSTAAVDWDDFMREIAAATAPHKRFLGSVARTWGPGSGSSWKPFALSSSRGGDRDIFKRHIGAVARMGLLPSGRDYLDLSKRHIGAVARMGLLSSIRGDGDGDRSKRHIGALARMGLLPAFRSIRYSRSERAVNQQPPQYNSPLRTRWRRVCYYREDPEYGTSSTKNKRGYAAEEAPPLDWLTSEEDSGESVTQEQEARLIPRRPSPGLLLELEEPFPHPRGQSPARAPFSLH